MYLTSGNIGGFIGIHYEFSVTIDHLSRASNDHPMFAAMVMHLQTQTLSGADLNTFDLEFYTFF